jgi:hypothetical protein
MITLITGLPGACKTLFALDYVERYAKKENREVYYHGVPELTLDWKLLDSPEDWIKVPNGSIIFIDECQSTFRPRANGAQVPIYVSEFETHRHKGLDIFLITQHPMLLDGNVRRLAGRHFHAVRFFGFEKSTIHEFTQVRENVDKNVKNSMVTHFVFPKDVFNWYKSSSLHTVKKRLPLRLFLIVILPIVLVAIIYFGYTSVTKISTAHKTQDQVTSAKSEVSTSSEAQFAKQSNNDNLTIDDYVKNNTPRIIDVVSSAPKYDEVTRPITAPYPAACYSTKFKCKCFTQQGTYMQVTELFCRQVVENGYFVDWEIKPKSDYNENMQAKNEIPKNEITQTPENQVNYVKPLV